MTDPELIQRLEELPPEEWSDEQLSELRQRARASEAIRAAVRRRLRLDTALGTVLGEVQLAPAALHAEAHRRRRRTRLRRFFLGVFLLGLLASGVIWLDLERRRQPPEGAAVLPPAAAPELVQAPAEQPAAELLPSRSPEAAPPDPTGVVLQTVETATQAPPATTATTDPPPPSPETPPVVPPISQLLEGGGEVRQFHQAAFEDFVPGTAYPSLSVARTWLTPHGKTPGQLVARNEGERAVVRGEGLFEVAPLANGAWTEDLVLELSLLDASGLRIHVTGADTRAVTLRYHSTQGIWAAYTSTRGGGAEAPIPRVLLSSDGGAAVRLGAPTVELRRHAGRLLLTAGELLVASAPEPGVPRQVLLEGRFALRGVRVFRCSPPPGGTFELEAPAAPSGPLAAGWRTRPAAGESPGPELRVESAGGTGARIEGRGGKGVAIYDRLSGKRRFRQVTFVLEDPPPESGVLLADGKGQAVLALAVAPQTQGGGKVLAPAVIDRGRVEVQRSEERGPVPLVGESLWLRFTLTPCCVRVELSGEGAVWAEVPLGSEGDWSSRIASHGVFLGKAALGPGLTLRGVTERELEPPGAASGSVDCGELVSGALVEAVERGSSARDLDARLRSAIFLAGPAAPASIPLRPGPLAALLDRWDASGELVARGNRRALLDCLARAPYPPGAVVDPIDPGLFHTQMLDLVHAREWVQVLELADWIQYFTPLDRPLAQVRSGRSGLTSIAAWARAHAARAPGAASGATDVTARAASRVRHPFLGELNKDVYNFYSELTAAVAGGAYRDACELLAQGRLQGVRGLVSPGDDPDLFLSLHRAVELLIAEHADLGKALRAQLEPLARLRLREASDGLDPAAMEAITLQFLGTDAAAEAHLWLGDRALAAGDFPGAASRYSEARNGLPENRREDLAARELLLSAYVSGGTGPTSQGPASPSRDAGSRTAGDIVRAARRVARSGELSPGELPVSWAAIPPGVAFEVRPWATLELAGLTRPPALRNNSVDWLRRQLGLVVGSSTRVLSTRSQVVAWDAATGERRWSQVINEDGGRWPCEPMLPFLAGNRVLCRRMTSLGPELAALDAATGAILWRARPGHSVVSEPLVHGGGAVCFAASVAEEGTAELQLCRLDLEGGEPTFRAPVVRLRDVYDRQISVHVAELGSDFCVSLGGVLLRCDLAGGVRWLRRLSYLDPEQDPDQLAVEVGPPVVLGSNIICLERGSRVVECVDAQTGRLRWRRTMLQARQLLPGGSDRVIIRLTGTVLALDVRGGETAWSAPVSGLSQLVAGPGGNGGAPILCSASPPALVWLEARTGRQLGRTEFPELAGNGAVWGPFAPGAGGLWAISAARSEGPLQVLELFPRQ